MAITNWKEGSSVSEDSINATESAWENSGNYLNTNVLSNGENPNAQNSGLSTGNVTSKALSVTGFGFDAAGADGVPVGATIDGIEVEVTGRCAVANKAFDSDVNNSYPILYISGTGEIGTGQPFYTAAGSKWPTSVTAVTYGGSTDKWSSSLTAAQARASTFGVRVAFAANTSGQKIHYVRYVRCRIHYTEGGGGDATATATATSSASATGTITAIGGALVTLPGHASASQAEELTALSGALVPVSTVFSPALAGVVAVAEPPASSRSFHVQSRISLPESQSGAFDQGVSLYSSIEGDQNTDAVRVSVGIDATINDAAIKITANSGSDDCTLIFQKNNVDTGLTVNVPAGQTGWFTSTGSASVTADENGNWNFVGDGAGSSVSWTAISMAIEPDSVSETLSILGVNQSSSNNSTGVGDAYFRPQGGRDANSDESLVQMHLGVNGTIQNYNLNTGSVSKVSDALFGVRIDGVDTDIEVAAAAAQSFDHVVDLVNSATVASTDAISWYQRNSADDGNINVEKLGANLITSTGQFVCFNAAHYRAATETGTVHYWQIGGPGDYSSTEADAESVVPFAFTVTKLLARAFNVSGTIDVTLRKNGSDTGLALAVDANDYFSTTGSVSFDPGDTICFESDSTGASVRMAYIGLVAAATGDTMVALPGAESASASGALSAIGGALVTLTGDGSASQALALTALGGAVVIPPGVASIALPGTITAQTASGTTVSVPGIASASNAGILAAVGGALVTPGASFSASSAGVITIQTASGTTVAIPSAAAISEAGILSALGGALVIVPDDASVSSAALPMALGGALVVPSGADASAVAGPITISAEGNVSLVLSGVGALTQIGTVSALGGALTTLTGAAGDALAGDVGTQTAITVVIPAIDATAAVGNVSVIAGTGTVVDLVGVGAPGQVGQLIATGGATVEVVGAESDAETGTLLVRGDDGQLVARVIIGPRLSGRAFVKARLSGKTRMN